MKKLLALTAIAFLAATAFTGCKKEVKEEVKETEVKETEVKETEVKETEVTETEAVATADGDNINIEITIKDYGTIKAELYPEVAPITVENFVKLADSNFYDGITFHRIIDGFMIQGGDPTGTGMGGSDEKIKGEFSQNGVENNLSHTRGVLSMARAQDMNSASSQFFIVHEDSTFLDGAYAAFGMVTEGIEIVDKICEDTPVVDNNGTVEPDDQPVIESIVVVK